MQHEGVKIHFLLSLGEKRVVPWLRMAMAVRRRERPCWVVRSFFVSNSFRRVAGESTERAVSAIHDAFTSSMRGRCRGQFRRCVYLHVPLDELLDARFWLWSWKTSMHVRFHELLEML